MILIYFFGFIAIVSIFGIITNRINQKAKCDHLWEDMGDDGIKCVKCDKSLAKTYSGERLTA